MVTPYLAAIEPIRMHGGPDCVESKLRMQTGTDHGHGDGIGDDLVIDRPPPGKKWQTAYPRGGHGALAEGRTAHGEEPE